MAIYYSSNSVEPAEAYFAGRLFILSASEETLMTIDTKQPLAVTKVLLHQLKGAFLYRDKGRRGWVLVFGDMFDHPIRYWDDGKDQLANALALQKLGVQVLSHDQVTANIRNQDDACAPGFTALERRQNQSRNQLFNKYKGSHP